MLPQRNARNSWHDKVLFLFDDTASVLTATEPELESWSEDRTWPSPHYLLVGKPKTAINVRHRSFLSANSITAPVFIAIGPWPALSRADLLIPTAKINSYHVAETPDLSLGAPVANKLISFAEARQRSMLALRDAEMRRADVRIADARLDEFLLDPLDSAEDPSLR
jgi:hypothetical protein